MKVVIFETEGFGISVRNCNECLEGLFEKAESA